MTTIQDIIGNYTPLANNIVQKIGIVRGGIACKVFFTSNLSDRICRMGLTRMAKELGISPSTASKNLGWLIAKGYIERLEKHTATEPAHYRCTQKFYDTAQGIDLINTPIDLINTPIDLINQEEESEEESKESTPPPDFIDDVFNKNGQVSEITGPNPEDQWFEYSSKFLKTFQEKMGRYPNPDEKAAISEIADMEGADLSRWEKALAECNLHYTGHKCPISRVIEVYQSGGTWADWQRWRGKQDEGPIKPKNEREKMLDPITGEWTGGYYS